jgi:hypothetical protein
MWIRASRWRKWKNSLRPTSSNLADRVVVYDRSATLSVPSQEIDAVLPLIDFKARLLTRDVAQVTYKSVVRYPKGVEHGLRSSIWTRAGGRWKLRFHQGTPIPIPPEK